MTEQRDGVALTSLDDPLFDGAGATKRDLLDYLEAVADRLLPELHDRPLSVVRVRPGQPPFMQKNLPAYAPEWVRSRTVWAAASHRQVRYPLVEDRRTLLWLGNQRAVEYHPTLAAGEPPHPLRLVLDLDPPEGAPFAAVVAAAGLVRQVLADAGLQAAVKTSGAKGVHVVVPLEAGVTAEDAGAATRALAARAERLDPALGTTAYLKEDRDGKVFLDATRSGSATLVAAYSPRARPGVPVSFPVTWEELPDTVPSSITLRTALARLGSDDPWRASLPAPQALPADLVAEGHAIPVARVQAMHEGKRRKRAREA
jgi:DNA ligase D-like protein (predicted polymerase)